MKLWFWKDQRYLLWAVTLLVFVTSGRVNADEEPRLTIYKDPSCGCCSLWGKHLEDTGFRVNVMDTGDLASVKTRFKIPPQYQSCHTAHSERDGYIFEGHIPERVIRRFLAEKPRNALGLAVPGMPIGSPGMEMDGRFQSYAVMLLREDGGVELYEQINAPEQIVGPEKTIDSTKNKDSEKNMASSRDIASKKAVTPDQSPGDRQ